MGLWVVILYINPERRTYPNKSVAVPLGVELHKLFLKLTLLFNLCFQFLYDKNVLLSW